jgi:hypothetical protein
VREPDDTDADYASRCELVSLLLGHAGKRVIRWPESRAARPGYRRPGMFAVSKNTATMAGVGRVR